MNIWFQVDFIKEAHGYGGAWEYSININNTNCDVTTCKIIINKRSFADNQKQNVSDLPNPNNASEDACKQELKRSNKYEEGACNIHKAHNAEKITLGGQKNEIFNEEQVC